jgi:SAM-dependent methyltransferase
MTVRSLRQLVVPPAVDARVATLVAENAEARTLAHLLGEAKMREWALSLGVCTDPVLESLAPAVPPREMRQAVGETEAEMFLWTGAHDLDLVLAAWESHATGAGGERPAILDFGCGCGRLARFLVPCAEAADVHAADVDAALVSWCRSNLPEIQTAACRPAPPLDHAAGTFDLVYAVSVLGHQAEDAIAAWVRELARVLRPGGVLVATTHGGRARERLAAESAVGRTRADDPRRPVTFLDEARARALAESAGLACVDFQPGGLRGWQDVVVARKP